MPSFNYNAMYQKAEKLLTKFGTFGTLTKKVFTTADSTKPWERTATETSGQVLMVVVPWSSTDESRYFSNDIIKSTSKGIILWDDDNQTAVDDALTYLGDKFTVIAQKPINPAGTGLIFVCALAGSAR